MNLGHILISAFGAVAAAFLLLAFVAARGSPESPAGPAAAGGLPDIIVTGMMIELETGGGCYTSTQLGLRVLVRNQGSGDAGAFVVEANGNQLTLSGGLAAGANGSLWFPNTYIWPGDNTATVDATGLVTESDETNNTHTKFVPIPTLPLPCTPTPTPTKQPEPADTDGDGCSDQRENGPDPKLGGQRDYTDFWDFFDTPDGANVRDRAVSGTDFFRILARFNATGSASIDPLSTPPAAPAYHTAFDRGPAGGPNVWTWYTPADGSIAGTDFFALLAQFGHSCASGA